MNATWDERHGWRCECGRALVPPGAGNHQGLVRCECGALYEFGYWALNRWPGDSGSTSLEPRRIIARGYGAVGPDGRDAA